MKRFEYTAVDREGRRVSGSVETGDWQAAEELLAAKGLRHWNQTTGQAPSGESPLLRSADAVEIVGYMAELAKAGLPLGPGLRALAKDRSSGRLAAALEAMSARLEAGHSLEVALDAIAPRLPAHMRGLIVAADHAGRLVPMLDDMLNEERRIDALTRQFWQAVTYPAILLACLIGWTLIVALFLVPGMQIGEILGEMSNGGVLLVSRSLIEFSRVAPMLIGATFAAVFVVVAAVRLIGGAALFSRLFSQLPLLGSLWWFRGLVEFSGLLAVFLRARMPLAEAVKFTGIAARDPAIKAACRKAFDQLYAGGDLSHFMAGTSLFPATLVGMVRWGEHHSALADALDGSRQMFLERFENQLQLVRVVLPPVAFLLIAASVLFVAIGTIGTMLKLILDFTG